MIAERMANEMETTPCAKADHEISEFFDRCAHKRLMYEFTEGEAQTLRRFMALWNLQPGERVLEPGCGSGRLTAILAEAVGEQGELLACDLSPEMIQLARERGLPSQVHLLTQSASSIPRADGWFNHVICLNVFPHFMEKEAILQEFARLLRVGGQLWIHHFEGRERLNHFHHHAAPEVSGHMLPCPRMMRKLIESAGLELAELIDETDAYRVRAIKRTGIRQED
jgi:ubiquinone/menaquinone biosynthesis C-methylase UbiE